MRFVSHSGRETGDDRSKSMGVRNSSQSSDLLGSGAVVENHPHIQDCEICRELYEQLKAIADAAKQLFPDQGPEDHLWDRIETAIKKEDGFQKSNKPTAQDTDTPILRWSPKRREWPHGLLRNSSVSGNSSVCRVISSSLRRSRFSEGQPQWPTHSSFRRPHSVPPSHNLFLHEKAARLHSAFLQSCR